MLISGNEPYYLLGDILHSLIAWMSFLYLGYSPSRSIWHLSFRSFLGVVFPVTNDGLEIREWRICSLCRLLTHLIPLLIPEITD